MAQGSRVLHLAPFLPCVSPWFPEWSVVLRATCRSFVSSRSELKIVILTFKILKFQQPAYMFDLIAPYIPPRSLRPSTRISSLCQISDQKWAADRFPLLHPSFGTLLSTHSFLGFIICFYWFAQDFLISKVSSAIVINSLHIVSSDFDLRIYNGHSSLPCISHSLHFSK